MIGFGVVVMLTLEPWSPKTERELIRAYPDSAKRPEQIKF